jgi:ABC-2 type transport system ATP-binding protein
MIFTENLGKRFNHFTAVEDVSLQVKAGEVMALLGPNGAGKTTTVRMLTSVLLPTWGSARVAGYDVVAQAQHVRSSVGVLTEHHGLYGRMNASDYLDFFGQLYSIPQVDRGKRIDYLLEEFSLSSDRYKKIAEYSKGMRQKLALARALLHKPPVLLLDEPTSAMDPESARLVRDAILSLRSSERAVVLCTHNLVEAEELSTHIAIIRKGRIIALGTPKELKERFFGPPEYEVRLSAPLNGIKPEMPFGASLTSMGGDWFRYQCLQPDRANPHILRHMVTQGLDILSLSEVPRSLETVYLQAVSSPQGSADVAS